MPPLSVERIIPTKCDAYQNIPGNEIAIMSLLTRAKLSGKWTHEPQQILLDDGGVGWRIKLTPLIIESDGKVRQGKPLICHPGFVIIECDDLALSVHDPVSAAATFTTDTELVWAATATAEASDDGTARITVRQPTSLSGPFTYALLLDGQPAEAEQTTAVAKSPGPNVGGLILGQDITLTVTGLTPGHAHEAVVVCTDGYGHEAQTEPVEFVVPEPEPEPEPDDDGSQ